MASMKVNTVQMILLLAVQHPALYPITVPFCRSHWAAGSASPVRLIASTRSPLPDRGRWWQWYFFWFCLTPPIRRAGLALLVQSSYPVWNLGAVSYFALPSSPLALARSPSSQGYHIPFLCSCCCLLHPQGINNILLVTVVCVSNSTASVHITPPDALPPLCLLAFND